MKLMELKLSLQKTHKTNLLRLLKFPLNHCKQMCTNIWWFFKNYWKTLHVGPIKNLIQVKLLHYFWVGEKKILNENKSNSRQTWFLMDIDVWSPLKYPNIFWLTSMQNMQERHYESTEINILFWLTISGMTNLIVPFLI